MLHTDDQLCFTPISALQIALEPDVEQLERCTASESLLINEAATRDAEAAAAAVAKDICKTAVGR